MAHRHTPTQDHTSTRTQPIRLKAGTRPGTRSLSAHRPRDADGERSGERSRREKVARDLLQAGGLQKGDTEGLQKGDTEGLQKGDTEGLQKREG